MESLTHLSLGGNSITGEIPDEIGNLTNLVYLGLFLNNLYGEIPASIGQLTNINFLLRIFFLKTSLKKPLLSL